MLDKRLLAETLKYKSYRILLVVNGVISFMTSFFLAFFIAGAVQGVFIGKESFTAQLPRFAGAGVTLLARTLAVFLTGLSFRNTGSRIKRDLRKRYAGEMILRGPADLYDENTGAAAVAACEAADAVSPWYFDYLPQFFVLVLSTPLLLLSVLFFDRVSFFIMLFTAPLLPFFLALTGMAAEKANRNRFGTLSRLGGSLMEMLNGMRTIKIFGRTQEYGQKLRDASEQFRKTTMEVLRISFLSAFVLELAATISTAVIAVSLGLRLMYGHLGFYEAFFVLLLTPDFYMNIRKFGMKYHTGAAAGAAADRIMKAGNGQGAGKVKRNGNRTGSAVSYKNEPGECESTNGKPGESRLNTRECGADDPQEAESSDAETLKSGISLRNVGFTYENSSVEALRGINMEFRPGELTAIVGKSGSGKSTLVKLLLGLCPPGGGSILINGRDAARTGREERLKLLSYIPQRPYMFYDTLLENIRLSRPDATAGEVAAAIEKAALQDFILRQPRGLETRVEENGASLSMGEIKRIAVARALLKNTPVVVIDEATSALDRRNEELLIRAFEELKRDRTVVIIAHRLETVKKADRIIVIDGGLVVQQGTHEQLMAQEGLYRELAGVWE